jgi:hypothetical protein
MWDAESGEAIGEPLRGHSFLVWCVAFRRSRSTPLAHVAPTGCDVTPQHIWRSTLDGILALPASFSGGNSYLPVGDTPE